LVGIANNLLLESQIVPVFVVMVWMLELKCVTITMQHLLMDVIFVKLNVVGIVLIYWTKQARVLQIVEMGYVLDQNNAVSITSGSI
jgi:hypothetical protein